MSGYEEDFVEAAADIAVDAIAGRHAAANVIAEVVAAGRTGDYPQHVSGKLLGAALWRITGNSNEEDLLPAILEGWCNAETRWGQAPGS